MKKFSLATLLTLFLLTGMAQTNYAVLTFEIYGQQHYRVDIKTNLTDAWYPYAGMAMWRNCIGTNTNGEFEYGPEVTAEQHQSCSVRIPVSFQQGFFRLYTLPENTNGVVWPTSNNVSVPFTFYFEQSVPVVPETNAPAPTHPNNGKRPKK